MPDSEIADKHAALNTGPDGNRAGWSNTEIRGKNLDLVAPS
jgi:hypothetical protein